MESIKENKLRKENPIQWHKDYKDEYKRLMEERRQHNIKLNEAQALVEKAERKYKRLIGKKGEVQALDKLMELEELVKNLTNQRTSLTRIHKQCIRYANITHPVIKIV